MHHPWPNARRLSLHLKPNFSHKFFKDDTEDRYSTIKNLDDGKVDRILHDNLLDVDEVDVTTG